MYQSVKEASDAEEVLNMLCPSLFLDKNHSIAQIDYACRETGTLVFRLSHQGTNDLAAAFPLTTADVS